jgi:hypothetical protein
MKNHNNMKKILLFSMLFIATLTAVVIGATGVPASRIDDGVAIAGATVGLASDYSIPDAITYKNQDANWQRGAVVL